MRLPPWCSGPPWPSAAIRVPMRPRGPALQAPPRLRPRRLESYAAVKEDSLGAHSAWKPDAKSPGSGRRQIAPVFENRSIRRWTGVSEKAAAATRHTACKARQSLHSCNECHGMALTLAGWLPSSGAETTVCGPGADADELNVDSIRLRSPPARIRLLCAWECCEGTMDRGLCGLLVSHPPGLLAIDTEVAGRTRRVPWIGSDRRQSGVPRDVTAEPHEPGRVVVVVGSRRRGRLPTRP